MRPINTKTYLYYYKTKYLGDMYKIPGLYNKMTNILIQDYSSGFSGSLIGGEAAIFPQLRQAQADTSVIR